MGLIQFRSVRDHFTYSIHSSVCRPTFNTAPRQWREWRIELKIGKKYYYNIKKKTKKIENSPVASKKTLL